MQLKQLEISQKTEVKSTLHSLRWVRMSCPDHTVKISETLVGLIPPDYKRGIQRVVDGSVAHKASTWHRDSERLTPVVDHQ